MRLKNLAFLLAIFLNPSFGTDIGAEADPVGNSFLTELQSLYDASGRDVTIAPRRIHRGAITGQRSKNTVAEEQLKEAIRREIKRNGVSTDSIEPLVQLCDFLGDSGEETEAASLYKITIKKLDDSGISKFHSQSLELRRRYLEILQKSDGDKQEIAELEKLLNTNQANERARAKIAEIESTALWDKAVAYLKSRAEVAPYSLMLAELNDSKAHMDDADPSLSNRLCAEALPLFRGLRPEDVNKEALDELHNFLLSAMRHGKNVDYGQALDAYLEALKNPQFRAIREIENLTQELIEYKQGDEARKVLGYLKEHASDYERDADKSRIDRVLERFEGVSNSDGGAKLIPSP